MRAVKDGLPAPCGEGQESEGPRSTAAVKSSSRPCWLGIEMGKRIQIDTRSGGQYGNSFEEMRNREGGHHRLYAEAADHTQRDTQDNLVTVKDTRLSR